MSAQTNIPEAYGLGILLGESDSRSDILRSVLPVGLIALGLLAIGYLGRAAYELWSTGEDIVCIGVIILVIFLSIVNAGIALAVQNHREGHWQVLAFEQGLILIREGGKQLLRWHDIAWLMQETLFTFGLGNWDSPDEGLPIFSYRVCTVQMQNDEKITFSGVKIKPLRELIQNEIKTYIIARAVAVYNSGGTVYSGNIAFDQAGIRSMQGPISWQEVEQIGEYEGVITIKRRRKLWGKRIVSFAKVQNAFVLPELINKLTGIQILHPHP